MMMLSAIILAAGESKRFDGNKLLYELDGKPLFSYLLDTIRMIPFDQMIVVSRFDAIKAYSLQHQMVYLHNGYPERGQSYSIHLGVRHADDDHHFMFFTADTPYISRSTIMALIQIAQQAPDAIICPSYQGELYSPTIFSRKFLPELLDIRGDRGGKGIIRRYMDRVILYEVESQKELMDIDYRSHLPTK
ncbi:nucleotidyltransferase family protein [Spirochaetales bacterium BR193]|uniref:Nucleotidyltransferase family protein n=2 Tax=Entomospira entomophila TaxID=2719988 RepID=A0A968GE18_9SPIO|nr:nucleotidyltransferase family protein [Entomospira entomophilus]